MTTMTYLEVAGSAYDIGRQQCERLGELAKIVYRRLGHCHADERPKYDRPAMITWLQQHWPAQLAEVRGYADGLGIDFEQVFDFNLGRYVDKLVGEQQCSNLGFRTSPQGPLLGGNLDDQTGYVVQLTRREGAYAHVGIVWPGWLSYWGGVNECGLAVSGSSARVRKSLPPEPAQPPAWHSVYTARLVLEECRNVPEAVEFLKRPGIAGHGNHIMIDDTGEGVVVETHKPTGPVIAEHSWEPGGWICCGNFFVSEISPEEALAGDDEYLRLRGNRVRILREFGARSETAGGSVNLLKETLRTHDGPEHGLGGICNQNNCCGVIYIPVERKILVAERFPCANEFVAYPLSGRAGAG